MFTAADRRWSPRLWAAPECSEASPLLHPPVELSWYPELDALSSMSGRADDPPVLTFSDVEIYYAHDAEPLRHPIEVG